MKPSPFPLPASASGVAPARVGVVLASGRHGCTVELDGSTLNCAVSTHLLALQPGQRVLLADGGPAAGWLVSAAWPLPGQAAAPLLDMDPASGTLRIEAAHLDLSALASIELRCGDARIRLSVDGKAHIEGAEVLSSAIGPNRIEGASIDLN